jgi:hypothetical protein
MEENKKIIKEEKTDYIPDSETERKSKEQEQEEAYDRAMKGI